MIEARANLLLPRTPRVPKLNRDGGGPRIFSGLECDIMKDGAMDLANDVHPGRLDIMIDGVQPLVTTAEQPFELLRARTRSLAARTPLCWFQLLRVASHDEL